MILLRKNLILAFICYIIYVSCFINPKLREMEEAVVLNLCKITELKKHKQLNVQIFE